MTSRIDSFSSIISAFSYLTQASVSDNFTSEFKLTSGKLINSAGKLLPEVVYSGAKLGTVDTAGWISSGDAYLAYTNYEKIQIKSTPKNMIGLSSNDVKVLYRLRDLNTNPGNNENVSYDVFEEIDPSYQKDELEFKVSLTSDYEIALVFAKAPPTHKVEYPELFNSDIHTPSSFWDYSASNLTDLCESDRLTSSERVVYLRVYKNGVVQPSFASGNFKSFNPISLGTDGRYALKSDITQYLVNSATSLVADQNGYVYNELKYPIKSSHTVLNLDGISKLNALNVQVSLSLSTQSSQITATVQLFDDSGTIKLSSSTVILPICDLQEIYSTVTVSSKTSEYDITLESIESYVGDSSVTEDPTFDSRYAPPEIYVYKQLNGGSLLYIDSSSGEISLEAGYDLIFRALPKYSSVNPNKVYSSIDGASYVNTYQATLEDGTKYGTHNFKAYINGTADIGSSIVAEKTIKVHPILTSPVFTYDITSGELIISCDSQFDVLYSTDGVEPDLEYRSNVALYTRQLKIKKRTVIKAVAVHGDDSSVVVQYVFDPDAVFTVSATLATITVSN